MKVDLLHGDGRDDLQDGPGGDQDDEGEGDGGKGAGQTCLSRQNQNGLFDTFQLVDQTSH